MILKRIEHPDYVFIEKEGGILELLFRGAHKTFESNTESTQQAEKDIYSLMQPYAENEVLLLAEMSPHLGVVSKTTIDIYTKMLDDPRISRVAIYGGLTRYFKIAATALRFVKKKGSIQVFRTKQEAMKWLLHQ